MSKQEQLNALEKELKELNRLDPAHCSGTQGYMPHSMTPELFKKIDDLESRISQLKKEMDIEAPNRTK